MAGFAMILFDLRCQDGHGFEAWFRDGATYEVQAAAGDIVCPICGDTHIGKAPMAPRISKRPLGDAGAPAPASSDSDVTATGDSAAVRSPMVQGELRSQLETLRRNIEENCEPVGDQFAEEARRIHYGEAPRRDIYGEATDSEAAELVDEGVEFARVPWPVRTDS